MRLQAHVSYALIWLPVLCASCCCSGTSTAVKFAVKAAGMTVDHAGVDRYQRELVGATPAAADGAFGERLDVLRDVDVHGRMWLLYPVEPEPPYRRCFVVEVHGNRIAALTKAAEGGLETDTPRKLMLQKKLEGKAPADCEKLLGMGKPLLTVRSKATGQLAQLYDARCIKKLDRHDYCRLRYDERGLCKHVDFVRADAPTKQRSRPGISRAAPASSVKPLRHSPRT